MPEAEVPTALTTEPQLNKPSFVCPFCKAFTGQTWVDVWQPGPMGFDTIKQYGMPASTGIVNMAICDKCHCLSLWLGKNMIYPQSSTAPAPHTEMPLAVLELYREAAAVLPHSRRAAAALIRAALERLLRELDPEAPKKTRLVGLIDNVAKRVSVPLMGALTAIRHVGNTSLHEKTEGHEDESVELFLTGDDSFYIELLFGATNDIVDELIARPKAYATMLNSLPENVRANAGGSTHSERPV